ncbi:MAG: ABC-F family ATP-binding cassette domain-containing protein [Bacteroidales bacterium]|nr:ABC-F family ATP-binding cassette domain-containing protein [Bacteroidales bacterium]MBQ6872173.1 ABC-F family ATP-binding cassette domain-containing protein [Bacteroidales bacterium]
MISINNLTVSFGGYNLFSDINFHISDNDRIGLVGKNGAGKSTLLKIILGINQPTEGKVMVPSGLTIGYLPQQMEHAKDKTVMEEALTAFSELFELHDKIDRLTAELGEHTDYESREYNNLIIKLNEYSDRVSVMESEPIQSQTEKILLGLGFKRDELDRPTSTFSQGWNMRIELAKVLLRKPDVLLLDEPTNHLDIESIEWFENYLKSFPGSIVLISHDRKFLDNITTRTVEIMLGKIYDYKVPYSKYKVLRKERMEQQKAAYENQQKMIEKTEEFIERFRYKATKSNQVQSRIKQLDKLERIEIDEEDKSALSVKFPPAPRAGQIVFKAKDATIGYGSKVVIDNVNVTIERGEKIAFVGRNGEGKTTLMKIITKELFPIDGEAALGYNVDMGYYAQNQEDVLDKNCTVFDTLDRIAVGDIRTKLRDILAAFLFRGEDIDKKVAVLSGGERARLAMAKLMLKPHNLLALDEPTNHMDLISKDILKQALQAYDGTLVIVSHDRDFLDGLVDKIYEFRDGKVKEHLGGVEDFLHRKRLENLNELERKASSSDSPASSGAQTSAQGASAKNIAAPTPSQLSYQEQKERDRERRKLQNKIDKCEKEIAQLEDNLKELEEKLSSTTDSGEIEKLSVEYKETKEKLDLKMEEWIELT